MSYGFHKYVCIDHQRHAKLFLRRGIPRCPDCGLTMLHVGTCVKIPKRGDNAAWAELWSRARSVFKTSDQWNAEQAKVHSAAWGKRLLKKILRKKNPQL